MSVSFFVEMGEIFAYKVSCMCPNSDGVAFSSYDDAALHKMMLEETNTPVPDCEDDYCIHSGIFVDPLHDASGTAEVNMSNLNARNVIEALGLKFDGNGGALDPRDLMARIDIALSIAPTSAEIPTVEYGKMTVCGRPEGYLQDRLQDLLRVCEDAVKLNRKVVWG